jgi:glycosyltransferase involved in cell wall biosynthesis
VCVAVGADAGGEWNSDSRLIEELREGGATVLGAGDIFHRRIGSLLTAAHTLRAALPDDALAGVAHAHTAMAAAVARFAGVKTVVATCHGWNLERDAAFDLQDALAFRLVHAITSPSVYWASILEQHLGMKDVEVIPVGLDLGRYPDIGSLHAQPSGFGRRRIVTLAELTDRKGIEDLLDAMPAVWQKHPGTELHLFGDGDRREAFERRAASRDDVGGRTVFHGFVPSPFARIADADIFCLPSRSDNFPVALMEGMLARLPVVATNVGGIPELAASSGCGRLVPARAPEALADALTSLLALEAQDRKDMGALGEAFIRTHCAIEVTVGRLAEVYRFAASRRRSAEANGSTPCA